MREDHKDALNEIEKLLPAVQRAAEQQRAARAAEVEAEVQVLERVVQMLQPHFDQLADIIVVRREEVSSEASPALNQFFREDYPEKGILLSEDNREGGSGLANRVHIYGRRLYLLGDGRLLLVDREGFREQRKRRGLRPDKQEVWGSTCQVVSSAEALENIVFVEAVLDTVKENLLFVVGLAEDAVTSSGERTAQLMKLLDLVN